ncbi:MAG: hypothetical protein HZC48_13195 [Nitrospirae bacterium]|nr:hypothetical protein [Nitrospirota bacterium]
MRTTLRIIIFLCCFLLSGTDCFSGEPWKFKKSYESKQLTENPFFLMTAADINKNGFKELIVTDFGKFGDHIEERKEWTKDWKHDNLFVLEWNKDTLKTKWSKQWDISNMKAKVSYRHFRAFEARQIVSWQVGDKITVETIPPYLGLEWNKGEYILHEQQGLFNAEPLIGSYVFPWLSASCYETFYSETFPNKPAWPQECLVGIRNFSGKGKRIVTVLEERTGDKEYKQTLRVRKFEAGYPIEWEQKGNTKYSWWSPGREIFVDRLNMESTSGLLILEGGRNGGWNLFDRDEKNNNYRIQKFKGEKWYGLMYDLPEVYLRSTQKKGVEEYWYYRMVEINPEQDIFFSIKKVTLKPDLTGFTEDDIDFSHNENFIGVGFFDLKDIDNDGLDEIILVEETGKYRREGEEDIVYSDVKDYIKILKWDGKEYKTMWVSPPYTKRGTKFLVEDIKNSGKKQLIVMTSNETIQIWERQ